MWQLCHRLWRRGLALRQPAVPRVAAGSSLWQLYFTVNIIPACRQSGGVAIMVAFLSLAAMEVSNMKISSAAGGSNMALLWRHLHLGEKLPSFWSNHTYWYLNSYPIILWSFFYCWPHIYSISNMALMNITLTVFACSSRCDGFGVAWGTMGGLPDNLWWHQRLRGRYYDVTVLSVYKSSMSLRRRGCCFGGVFAAGCTWDCHSDNFQCGR